MHELVKHLPVYFCFSRSRISDLTARRYIYSYYAKLMVVAKAAILLSLFRQLYKIWAVTDDNSFTEIYNISHSDRGIARRVVITYLSMALVIAIQIGHRNPRPLFYSPQSIPTFRPRATGLASLNLLYKMCAPSGKSTGLCIAQLRS